MKHVFDIRSLEIENAFSFQMHLVQEPQPTQLSTKKRKQVNTPQTTTIYTLPAVCSMIQSAHQAAAPLAVRAYNEFSLKERHSQHARQRTDLEEGFTSITLVAANVLFPAHVVLTVHSSIKTAVH